MLFGMFFFSNSGNCHKVKTPAGRLREAAAAAGCGANSCFLSPRPGRTSSPCLFSGQTALGALLAPVALAHCLVLLSSLSEL